MLMGYRYTCKHLLTHMHSQTHPHTHTHSHTHTRITCSVGCALLVCCNGTQFLQCHIRTPFEHAQRLQRDCDIADVSFDMV